VPKGGARFRVTWTAEELRKFRGKTRNPERLGSLWKLPRNPNDHSAKEVLIVAAATHVEKKTGKVAHKEMSKIALEAGIARRRASMRPNAKGGVIRTPDHREGRR